MVEVRSNLQWRWSRERPVRLGMKRRFHEAEEDENGEEPEREEEERPSLVAERNEKNLLQAREERSRVALSIVVVGFRSFQAIQKLKRRRRR